MTISYITFPPCPGILLSYICSIFIRSINKYRQKKKRPREQQARSSHAMQKEEKNISETPIQRPWEPSAMLFFYPIC